MAWLCLLLACLLLESDERRRRARYLCSAAILELAADDERGWFVRACATPGCVGGVDDLGKGVMEGAKCAYPSLADYHDVKIPSSCPRAFLGPARSRSIEDAAGNTRLPQASSTHHRPADEADGAAANALAPQKGENAACTRGSGRWRPANNNARPSRSSHSSSVRLAYFTAPSTRDCCLLPRSSHVTHSRTSTPKQTTKHREIKLNEGRSLQPWLPGCSPPSSCSCSPAA